MNDFKSILASKTIWGGAVALVAGLAGLFGFTIGADDQALLVEAITAAASAIGGAVAIFGRVVATKRIS